MLPVYVCFRNVGLSLPKASFTASVAVCGFKFTMHWIHPVPSHLTASVPLISSLSLFLLWKTSLEMLFVVGFVVVGVLIDM